MLMIWELLETLIVLNQGTSFKKPVLIATVPKAHAGDVNCLDWSSGISTPLLASAGDDHIVNIWRLNTS